MNGGHYVSHEHCKTVRLHVATGDSALSEADPDHSADQQQRKAVDREVTRHSETLGSGISLCRIK
jgi:hypothetical protein